MKRLTTDTQKDNLEAALNLFYIKDHETWVRGYGPAPEYADVSLFDLTRDIVKTHIPDVELPEDEFLDWEKVLPEAPTFKIGFNGNYLLSALKAAKVSAGNSFKSPIILEFRSQTDPVVIHTNKDDVKMILPIRIKEA